METHGFTEFRSGGLLTINGENPTCLGAETHPFFMRATILSAAAQTKRQRTSHDFRTAREISSAREASGHQRNASMSMLDYGL